MPSPKAMFSIDFLREKKGGEWRERERERDRDRETLV